MYTCGNHIREKLQVVENSVLGATSGREYVQQQLYTAYLGKVTLYVAKESNPNEVSMECTAGRNNDIVLRVVDAIKGRIDYNSRPSLRQISHVPPATVNVQENKETYFKIQQLEVQKARASGDSVAFSRHTTYLQKFQHEEPQLYGQLDRKYSNLAFNAETLRALYVKNSCVDIHFNTQMFLRFLQEKLNRESINNGKLLVSIFNVENMDNAFFSGEYMLYGNGKDMFYPLSSIDISAHELTHGLVQSTAGLKYEGHSGALNESFSDIMGTAFEFWLYDRFNNDSDTTNDLEGSADWLCGEDVGKTVKYLRNIRDPTKAERPQPKVYRGQYWADPNKTSRPQDDYGGVHINSGISNCCFYLLTERVKLDVSLPVFYNCLLKLNTGSDFIDFRETLLECTPESLREHTQASLDQIGLNASAVSDWYKSPAENRRPKTPNPNPNPNPNPQPRPRPSQVVPFPNPHVPYIRGLCCPHCLCLQNSSQSRPRRLFAEVTREESDQSDIEEHSDYETQEEHSDSSSSDEPVLRRSTRLRKRQKR